MAITLDGTTGITTPGLTNTGTETIVNLTTTGNTILGNASTDTLNVGNGDLIKDASGNLSIASTNTNANSWQANNRACQVIIGTNSTSLSYNNNVNNSSWATHAYNNTSAAITGWKYDSPALYAGLQQFDGATGNYNWYKAPISTGVGNAITFTTAMTLNANGNLALQGGTTSATGVGITFPATQSASTDANTLDDYEEGTWTPTWLGSSTAGSTAYSAQVGRYTKVGRLVSLYFDVAISSATGTGSVTIGGVPFASGNQVISAGSITSYGVVYTGNTLASAFLSAASSFVIYSSITTANPSQVAMANAVLELAGTLTYTI